MRRLKIVHRTRYTFSEPISLGPHRLLLRPREGHELHIESSVLEITPPASVRWLRDIYDNSVSIASFQQRATQLVIHSEVIVQHYDDSPLNFLVDPSAVDYPFQYEAETAGVLQPYVADPAQHWEHEAVRRWLDGHWQMREKIETYSVLQRLSLAIKDSLSYQVREEPGVQSAAETLSRGAGSCRDFANLFMAAARALGLAARFVSGYLVTTSAGDGATHAWAEVYLPGAGWKGFDPTLGEMVGSKHIAVAVARVADAVSPVAGSYFGPPGANLYVNVAVTPL